MFWMECHTLVALHSVCMIMWIDLKMVVFLVLINTTMFKSMHQT